ncbi:MAG: hypothetical protein AB8B50_04950 [Pirellulaceae bacterium]
MPRIIMTLSAALFCLVASDVAAQTSLAVAKDYKIRRIVTKVDPAPPIKKIPLQVLNLKQNVGGSFVEFEFASNYKAAALVKLRNLSSPTDLGDAELTSASKLHQVSLVNLQPDTRYKAQIDLLPSESFNGEAIPYTVEFKTLQRHVYVGISNIHVFDDSDELSAGDMNFVFQIGDEHGNFNTPGNSWDFINFDADLDSGTNFSPAHAGRPHVLAAENVNFDKLKIAVSNFETDGRQYASYIPPTDMYLGSGCLSLSEWNSGFIVVDIAGSFLTPDAETAQKRESMVQPFAIMVSPTDETDLHYLVEGLISVGNYAAN